jgi:hypothetical protein
MILCVYLKKSMLIELRDYVNCKKLVIALFANKILIWWGDSTLLLSGVIMITNFFRSITKFSPHVDVFKGEKCSLDLTIFEQYHISMILEFYESVKGTWTHNFCGIPRMLVLTITSGAIVNKSIMTDTIITCICVDTCCIVTTIRYMDNLCRVAFVIIWK